MTSFCKECDNILDISKTKPTSTISDEDTPNDVTSSSDINGINYDNIIEKLENDIDIDDKELDKIDFIVLQHNTKLKEKSIKIKRKIKKKIDEMINKKELTTGTKAYFVCNNCSYSKEIKAGELIISRLSGGKTNIDLKLTDKQKNKLFTHTLPHTREYNCPNKKCGTYKGVPNDAKFFRTRGTTHTWYLCCVCHETWQIS
jgi:hypothetical protein